MKLDRRQKILIPLIIIAFIYIIWQVYDLFFASSEVIQPPVRQHISQPALHLTSATANGKTAAMTSVSGNLPASVAHPASSENRAPVKKNINILSSAGQSSNYLKMVKQYQQLESERMLLQEEVQIAEMKQKIASLNSKLNQLPSAGVAAGITTSGHSAIWPGYKLIYLDRQSGRWSATLADSHNVYREVSAGSSLPDGSKIATVTQHGVVITQGNQAVRLTFAGVTHLDITQVHHMLAKPHVIHKRAKVIVPKHKPVKHHIVKTVHHTAPTKATHHVAEHKTKTSSTPTTTVVTHVYTHHPVETSKSSSPVSQSQAGLSANYKVIPVSKVSAAKPDDVTAKAAELSVVELSPANSANQQPMAKKAAVPSKQPKNSAKNVSVVELSAINSHVTEHKSSSSSTPTTAVVPHVSAHHPVEAHTGNSSQSVTIPQLEQQEASVSQTQAGLPANYKAIPVLKVSAAKPANAAKVAPSLDYNATPKAPPKPKQSQKRTAVALKTNSAPAAVTQLVPISSSNNAVAAKAPSASATKKTAVPKKVVAPAPERPVSFSPQPTTNSGSANNNDQQPIMLMN
ncbi:MAG: hypothetical protein KAT71_04750 [Gammaproteobacteria bacterium]|nr:hypothetical protein [Gammaproteobacteria bacterium]